MNTKKMKYGITLLVRIKVLVLLSSIFIINESMAQLSGCPYINAGNDQTLTCSNPCTSLSANTYQTYTSTSYSVNSIPYTPPFAFNNGTPVLVGLDDVFSNIIPIPFSFCFFGNTYTQLVIGANGMISFDIANANGNNNWNFSDPVPSSNLPLNSIFAPYHDIDPSNCGSIQYTTLGQTPCRIFIINFNNICHYDCPWLQSTSQIALYETTNEIDIYIQNKPTCFGWNNGNSLLGIQNNTGTLGYSAPGRNTGPWSTSTEAWKFTPSGTPNFNITWWNGPNQIGSGSSINICVTDTTSFVAQVDYANCDGSVYSIKDTIVINYSNDLVINPIATDTFICVNGTTQIMAAVSGGIPPYTLNWTDNSTSSPIIGNGPHIVSPTISPTCYSVFATDSTGCYSDTNEVCISLMSPIIGNTTQNIYNICEGSSVNIDVSASGGNGNYNYDWYQNGILIGNGSIINVTPVNAPSTYVAIITDNCTSPSDTVNITVNWFSEPSLDFTKNNTNNCTPATVEFINISSPDSLINNSYWTFSDGMTIIGDTIQRIFNSGECRDLTLFVNTIDGCLLELSKNNFICTHTSPIADFTFNPQNTSLLFPTINFINQSIGNDLSYLWNFYSGEPPDTSAIMNPTYDFPDNQSNSYHVSLTVTDSLGCVDSISKTVKIDDIFLFYIPNSFTPDNDNLNEVFKPIANGIDIEEYHMEIFNKWGEKIFFTKSY